MGKHKNEVMSTHWAECWMAHSDCFWGRCIKLGVKYDTTTEYQAHKLFVEACAGKHRTLKRKEINNER